MVNVQRIYVGGWFQRTTLHLSEIYDFLKEAQSPLDLDKNELFRFRESLDCEEIIWVAAGLEYIQVVTTQGIKIKIFEDGLIVLGKEGEGRKVEDEIRTLTEYYEKRLSPAISYIFSLGAPVPKELANIKTIYPYFLVLQKAREPEIQNLLQSFGQERTFTIKKKEFSICRGDKLYIINNIAEKPETIEAFIEEQIFLREFKGQMHRYLNLHRSIWERIANVKEKGTIRGEEINLFYAKIQSYAKTINLIDGRINQMGSYIRTRATIAKSNLAMEKFKDVLQFKYETMEDTLAYIKELWKMTKNYVDSAQNLFASIQAKSTEASVKNLTIITSMGVGATLIGLFSQKIPEFTLFGVGYFFTLAIIGYLANEVMKRMSQRRMYKINDAEIAKDL